MPRPGTKKTAATPAASVMESLKSYLVHVRPTDGRDFWDLLTERPELVRERDAQNFTVLHHAVRGHDVRTVERLLDPSKPWAPFIEVDAKAPRPSYPEYEPNYTPLHLASDQLYGRDSAGGSKAAVLVKIMKLLIERGADVNMQCGGTLLFACVYNGFPATFIKYLIDKGADPCTFFVVVPGLPEFTVMHYASERQYDPDCKYLPLLLRPCNVNRKTGHERGVTPLEYAVRDGLFKTVKYLLDHGAMVTEDVISAAERSLQQEVPGSKRVMDLLAKALRKLLPKGSHRVDVAQATFYGPDVMPLESGPVRGRKYFYNARDVERTADRMVKHVYDADLLPPKVKFNPMSRDSWAGDGYDSLYLWEAPREPRKRAADGNRTGSKRRK